MRPSDLYFFLVPSPAGVGAFFAQQGWLAAILVATALTLLGLLVRFANFFIKDLERAGGYTAWKKEGYAAVPDREAARNTELRGEEGRRMTKLENKQQRREFKGRAAVSSEDQLELRV